MSYATKTEHHQHTFKTKDMTHFYEETKNTDFSMYVTRET